MQVILGKRNPRWNTEQKGGIDSEEHRKEVKERTQSIGGVTFVQGRKKDL
jgi:hypothetical protein